MITYHPDPEINRLVAIEANEGERIDVAAGFPPRRWTCECGASHSRGFFPIGGTGHRCLRCGYVGPGGVMDDPETLAQLNAKGAE